MKVDKKIEDIESLEPIRIRPFESFLEIDPNTISDEAFKVERALGFKERWKFKKGSYRERGGWKFCGNAYVLKNKRPICGQSLYVSEQTSPRWTWLRLCGRQGFLVYCPHCKKDINFYLTMMN